MKLTAQLTTLEQNPVEYLAFGDPEILDEADYAGIEDVELALDYHGDSDASASMDLMHH